MAAKRHLLVGFDGSPAAWVALRRAARIAQRDHACLTVVLALDVARLAGACVFTGAPLPFAVLERDAGEELRRAVDELPDDISIVSRLALDAAGPALAQEARRIDADAILIGSRRGVCSRLTGGVARYLRRHAHAPVIVVPSAPPRRRHIASTQGRTAPPAGGAAARPA